MGSSRLDVVVVDMYRYSIGILINPGALCTMTRKVNVE